MSRQYTKIYMGNPICVRDINYIEVEETIMFVLNIESI
nr:MAG TPA: hypothetical protein [Caudoviricetes sp.]